MCVDGTGKVDAVTILDVGPDVRAFGTLSAQSARRWKLSPFLVRGKPVRACGTVLTAYPGERLSPSDRSPMAAYPPPPAAPPPAPVQGGSDMPHTLPPQTLEALRLGARERMEPDEATKVELAKPGSRPLVGVFKLCVSATGTITSVSILKSSGFEAYDQKITRAMATWAYTPFEVNGKPVPVCTAITVRYPST